MTAAGIPELGIIVDPSGLSTLGLAKRLQCEVLRSTLETERATFMSHWKDLNDFIRPRRGRFYVTDVNKGDRRSRNILDSTATMGARTLAAGLMSGISSPARPWFRLTVQDQSLAEMEEVKEWLYEVERRMHDVFGRSNFYDVLQIIYGDLGVFGTAAMAVYEDDRTVIRCYDFPIGSYCIANDARLEVKTFTRVFRLTVDQIVQRWGDINPKTGKPSWMEGRPCSISFVTRNLWERNNRAAWIDLCHVVQPNLAYDGHKIEAKYKAFEDIYYELGAPNQPGADTKEWGLLAHSGFEEFPILCPRWEKNSEDVYATDCPGMTALGDIRELQTRAKRIAQAQEKMVNPPMVGPSALRNAKASVLPGDITYLDVREGQQKFESAYNVNWGSSFGPMEETSQQTRNRIKEAFYVGLFLMMNEDDRATPPTATEVTEKRSEKMLALGPVLERLNSDLFDPAIDRTFNIMLRKGLIPPPPDVLQGQHLNVAYVSVMAEAQKSVGLASLDRFAGFIGQAAQFAPSVLDMVNTDELVKQYAQADSIPPKILLPDDQVAHARQQRQKQLEMQQAAENAPALAGAAKDLSQADPSGSNLLASIVGRARAKQTLAATSQPAA